MQLMPAVYCFATDPDETFNLPDDGLGLTIILGGTLDAFYMTCLSDWSREEAMNRIIRVDDLTLKQFPSLRPSDQKPELGNFPERQDRVRYFRLFFHYPERRPPAPDAIRAFAKRLCIELFGRELPECGV